jgi:heme/copper-type cytochrome/quinol oxidase subunit 2
MNRKYLLRSFVLMGLVGAMGAHADVLGAGSTQAMPEYKLVIRNHQFTPSTLTVPANTKFKVLVTNQDSTPSEFESNDFSREKIVLPGTTVTVFIGPLDKGHYKFFDDFHQSTGNGVLIVE